MTPPNPPHGIERIADDLVDQSGEPWPNGSDRDRLHYWRDKAIKASRELRAALQSPHTGLTDVERATNDFAVKVTEHAIMELDADEENAAQIEAFGVLVEQEFRAAIAALSNTSVPVTVSEGMLREALTKCRDKFDFYVAAHMAKQPPDMDKAASNQEMVELCEAALAMSADNREGR